MGFQHFSWRFFATFAVVLLSASIHRHARTISRFRSLNNSLFDDPVVFHDLKRVAIGLLYISLMLVPCSVLWLTGCGPSVTREVANLRARQEWVETTLKRLTLEEKIGQMI